ncbi:DUF1642 domain-containing protein [Lactococcus petauri]|nr:DUF1642 domain-containing protein [Lactococcus petauri]
MKKFEEEMKEWFGSPTGFNMEFQSGYEAYCALIKRFKDWVSPEAHQAEIEKIELQNLKYREEIARMQKALRKKNKAIKELNGAVKKTKARLKECEKLRIEANNEAASEYSRKCEVVEERAEFKREIEKLKSQLEKQQPEIPEFVAAAIEAKNHIYGDFRRTANITHYSEDVRHWYYAKPYHAELFYRAILDDYTVAKEKRFYLKNKLTKKFLAVRIGHEVERVKIGDYQEVRNLSLKNKELFKVAFTQQEIDSMETGSYEQIEVEE